ncbi:DUF1127 domain-containing protein [Thioclava sp.]|uniref:DUF1127 domain-containing protein n=1 Tax=Thioclava sp. TaxID=1933450 RepID=UPI003AA8E744
MQTFPPIRTYIDDLHGYYVAQRAKDKESGGALRRWLRTATRRWERRKMIVALKAMDDRMLRDIGIHRGDIARMVDGLSDRELRMTPLAPSGNPNETYDDIYRKAA